MEARASAMSPALAKRKFQRKQLYLLMSRVSGPHLNALQVKKAKRKAKTGGGYKFKRLD